LLPILAVALLGGGVLTGCGAKMPPGVGLEVLSPCPDTPNCVSSLAPDANPAAIPALEIVGPVEVAWAAVFEVLESWSRVRIVATADSAIHAEATSLMFRYVDDLELRLRASDRRIDVRSASRIGRSDLGANRRRVEKLREALAERGVVARANTDSG